MFKARRRIGLTLVYIFLSLIFLSLAVFLVPQTKINDFVDYSNTFPTTVTAVLFCVLIMIASTLYSMVRLHLEKSTMRSGETAFLTEFTDKLRLCYSMEELYNLIADVLEVKADCSVLYINRMTNYVLYNSPNRLSSDPARMELLERNYSIDWEEGTFFLGDNFGIVSKSRKSRGFFISSRNWDVVSCARRLFPVLSRFLSFQRNGSSLQKLSVPFCRRECRKLTGLNLPHISVR